MRKLDQENSRKRAIRRLMKLHRKRRRIDHSGIHYDLRVKTFGTSAAQRVLAAMFSRQVVT